MIQPLRTGHRRVFVALACTLPAILGLGLGSRRAHERNASAMELVPSARFVMKKSDRMWQQHAIVTEFYGDTNNSVAAYVVLRPTGDLNEPDLLLYWVTPDMQGSTLPANARLLGRFVPGKLFALDPDSQRSGRLVLYSGAHQSIVDTSLVERLP